MLSPATREQIARAYAELGRRLGEFGAGRRHPVIGRRRGHGRCELCRAVRDLSGRFRHRRRGRLCLRAAGRHCSPRTQPRTASRWSAAPDARSLRRRCRCWSSRSSPPRRAGVAFTADPVTGATDAVAINASWGLGQSVVDGEVEADTWRVDRATLAVVEQRVGDKPTRSGLRPDAAREAVPDRLRREPCLTAAEVSQVAALALRAEAAIGTPADVEWATAGGTLWLLQARPITTGVAGGVAAPSTTAQAPAVASVSTGPTAAFPFVWPDAETERLHWALFARGDSVEPVLPLREDGALASSRAEVERCLSRRQRRGSSAASLQRLRVRRPGSTAGHGAGAGVSA